MNKEICDERGLKEDRGEGKEQEEKVVREVLSVG